jgi:hypothetical protein
MDTHDDQEHFDQSRLTAEQRTILEELRKDLKAINPNRIQAAKEFIHGQEEIEQAGSKRLGSDDQGGD